MIDRVHVTQDDHGYWMSVRQAGADMQVLTWGAERVATVLDEVWAGPETEVWYSEPTGRRRRIGAASYAAPSARRARRPYTRHSTALPRPEDRS